MFSDGFRYVTVLLADMAIPHKKIVDFSSNFIHLGDFCSVGPTGIMYFKVFKMIAQLSHCFGL